MRASLSPVVERAAQQGAGADVAQRVPIDSWYLLALNSDASATVGGLCHAAERPRRWAALTLAALRSGPQISCMTKPTIDIAAMTAHERLELAEELWNSLAADPEALPLSNEQAAELDRRVAAYRADRDPGRPWAEVLAEIEAAHDRRSA